MVSKANGSPPPVITPDKAKKFVDNALCDADAVKTVLLEYGPAIVNAQNEYGQTALFSAAVRGHMDILRMLDRYGADVNIRDRNGRTALIEVAIYGNASIAEWLLAHGAGIDAKDKENKTALAYAEKHHDKKMARLLKEWPQQRESYQAIGDFCTAAAAGDFAAMEEARKRYPGDIADKENLAGEKALLLAAEGGHIEIVASLLEKDHVDIHGSDPDRHTALMRAAERGHADIVALLLEKGARASDRAFSGDTALLLAASTGTKEAVTLLLDAGADIEARHSYNHRTPLICAAARGQTDIVKILLERGAWADTQDNSGKTALMWAKPTQNTGLIELLQKAEERAAHAPKLRQKLRSPGLLKVPQLE